MSTFALGVAAAVVAPLVTTLGFIVWDNNWTGSAFSLNLFKCNLASIWFLVASLATRVSPPFPPDIFTFEAVGFLMLSSTIGIVIGDFLWLEALRLLGTRRVIVVDTLKPFLAALMGWAILGEQLRPAAFGGMILTIGGVFLVSREQTQVVTVDLVDEVDGALVDGAERDAIVTTVTEPEPQAAVQFTTPNVDSFLDSVLMPTDEAFEVCDENPDNAEAPQPERSEQADSVHTPTQGSLREIRTNSVTSLRQGYLMAAVNVILDTYGSVLTKQYGINMSTWEISLIRFGFAGVVMLLLSIAMATRARMLEHLKDSRVTKMTWYCLPINMSQMAWFKIVIGVALVTFLAPALSNFALFQIALALALTLGSVGPLYSLPFGWLLQNDKPTICASVGAALAVAGVVVLSFVGTPD
jgi:drug/metabolite transporter (DMT)-like permease